MNLETLFCINCGSNRSGGYRKCPAFLEAIAGRKSGTTKKTSIKFFFLLRVLGAQLNTPRLLGLALPI